MSTEMVVEEVADNLEEAAQVVRKLDTKAVGFLLGGLAVGVVAGFYFGYRYNREKIRAEAFEQSEEELQRIREYYGRTEKKDLDKIIEEKGYADKVEPPSRPLPAPVPVREPEPFEPPLVEATEEAPVRAEENSKDKNAGWSYPVELSQRTPNAPYIIHQDEFMENESEFSQVTLTYYETDDVLADVDDSILRHDLVGENTLSRFGHGSDDFNVLYVRNPHLEMEYEICRVQKSFEVEVQGLDGDEPESSTETD